MADSPKIPESTLDRLIEQTMNEISADISARALCAPGFAVARKSGDEFAEPSTEKVGEALEAIEKIMGPLKPWQRAEIRLLLTPGAVIHRK